MNRAKKLSGLETSAEQAGDEVDAQLTRYRSMRDFKVTAEPSGSAKATKQTGPGESAGVLPFVIQKHAATRLHYDFRLGWHGVLKSWAVAKGPSYNVHDRRLAVEVEDHPMEYGGFEGIIPRGQYGGGTVMVWDQGTWQPHVDVDEGLRKGNLKFALHGTKLHGNWTLVRMGGKASHESKPNWLLIKEHDEYERPDGAPCITEEAPDSAVTGRSLEQIATAETHVWNSKETAGTGQAWYRQRAHDADVAARPKSAPKPVSQAILAKQAEGKPSASVSNNSGSKFLTADVTSVLAKLPQEVMPEFLKPQLATKAENPPTEGQWLHELKLDGYRMQVHKRGAAVSVLTRTGLDWTYRVKPMQAALMKITAEEAIVDGEVVVLDAHGLSSFARLQASFEKGESHPLTYFAFDLLHLNGRNTRDLPLVERKRLLRSVLGEDTDQVRLSEHLHADGEAVFHKACELHAEGIISKKADAKYTPGRSHAWLKSKCLHEQEFVIGGWVDLSNGTRGVGSLLLGYYDDAGRLIYAGKTGTGFTQKTHRMLRDKLDAMVQGSTPFGRIPNEARRGAHWVVPEMVAQVRFATWTSENQLRQAAFQGLREDKPAKEVRKEEAAPTPKRARSVKATSYAGDKADESMSQTQDIGQAHADELPVKPLTQKRGMDRTKPAGTTKIASDPLPMPKIRLTHPQKVVDPASGVTKQQLAQYLYAVSEKMLPHIANRPLSLVRCPEGSAKPCFYQKHVNHMLPPGVGSVMVADKKGGLPEPYITLNTVEALTGLAQMTVLEIHPWGSHNDDLEHPDRIVIDLDPDESLPWSQLAESAAEVRDRLKKLGLQSFLKTTGGKGLHVVFPLVPEYDFSVMKAWSHGFVQQMEKENPRLYLTKMTKAARAGKIYLDYLRNERGATAVAPYSMRARAGMPVSVPLEWKDLLLEERPQFRIDNFQSEWQSRLKQNPWKKIGLLKQKLSREVVERFSGKLR